MKREMEKFPQAVQGFIREVSALADEKGVPVYLVGGCVRDLFLGADHQDLDFVVEGDGIAFAEALSHRVRCKLVVHRRFGTATLGDLAGGFKVDIASSRRETYQKPGALPEVSPGTIGDDLFRRDFTINAMALCVNAARFGQLLDIYGGLQDLNHKVVRVLHPLSFRDDATRILRAARFEQRFSFKMEKNTLRWLKTAVRDRMLDTVGKHRLRDELVLICREKEPVKALKRLNDLAGLSFIAPALRYRSEWASRARELADRIAWFERHCGHRRRLEAYVIYLALIFSELPAREAKKATLAFAFHRSESSRILSLCVHRRPCERLLPKKTLEPSEVHRLLAPLSSEVLLLLGVLSRDPLARCRVADFLCVTEGHCLQMRGDDLKAAGIKPGPKFKKILDATLAAKINGHLKTKAQEIAFAKRFAEKME